MVGPEIVKIGEREIEIRALTFIERAPIKDEIEERFVKISETVKNIEKAISASMSLDLCGRVVKMATALKDADLDNMDDLEIKELASAILNKTYLKPDVKKK